MRKSILFFVSLFTLILLAFPAIAGDPKSASLQMTTTLENSDTDLQFNYAENIGDGRGITFGCIGFCTGTYDGNILIHYYTTLNPSNSLAKYIPALDKIDAGSHNAAGGDGNPSTIGLSGFIKDVQNCKDPLFKQAQLYELDELYWNPAQTVFNSYGYRYALTQALLYDCAVRQGPDGMRAIAKAAKAKSTDEISFISNFILGYEAKLKSEGLGDTNRMAGFKDVLASGNYNLVTPYTFTAYGDKFTITGDLGVDMPINNSTPTTNTTSKPIANFTMSKSSGKAPPHVTFMDQSTGSPTSYKWSFGDGKYSTAQNPDHKYRKFGKYKVTLTVKNRHGSNSLSKYISVYRK